MCLVAVAGIPVMSNTLNLGVEILSSYPVMIPLGDAGGFHVTSRDEFEFGIVTVFRSLTFPGASGTRRYIMVIVD